MPKKNRPFKSLETSLSYNFQDQELLKQALTRRSAVEEHIAGAHQNDNQRLEMLGDTVLRTQLTRIIFQYPEHFAHEEAMTQKIDSMVNKTRQAEIARTLNLQNNIICGRSEKQILEGSNSAAKDTILSDTLEALLGAVDSVGTEKSKAINNLIQKLWASDLPFLNMNNSVATSQPTRRSLSPTSNKILNSLFSPPTTSGGLMTYEAHAAQAREKDLINHPHPDSKKGLTPLANLMRIPKNITLAQKESVAAILVKYGALWDAPDNQGKTAESIAREKGQNHIAIMQRLQNR